MQKLPVGRRDSHGTHSSFPGNSSRVYPRSVNNHLTSRSQNSQEHWINKTQFQKNVFQENSSLIHHVAFIVRM